MAIKLGDRAKDRMTGFKGIVTATHEFLTGCTKITITPEAMKDGKPLDAQWFDESTCEVVKENAFEMDKKEVEKRPGGPMKMPRAAKLPR